MMWPSAGEVWSCGQQRAREGWRVLDQRSLWTMPQGLWMRRNKQTRNFLFICYIVTKVDWLFRNTTCTRYRELPIQRESRDIGGQRAITDISADNPLAATPCTVCQVLLSYLVVRHVTHHSTASEGSKPSTFWNFPTSFVRIANRMHHKISFPTLAYAPNPTLTLLLSQREQNIFRFLKRAADKASPAVELRVAGGWVRDKLLHRDTGDIDIAVRFTTGIRFAEHVHSVARSSRVALPIPTCSEYMPTVSSVARIKPNPAMSRHLETAAVRLDDIDLDFVHLRTDDYAEDNRIPIVRHGTPMEDAYRRDFTVNSLFYNLHSREIEDLTNRGLSDLESRLLRTPLNPCTTLLDDPLRALRAIRFACTLNFDLCPQLSEALEGTELRAVLRRKVSRERVGLEVMQMVTSNDPVRGLKMIVEFGLAESVFGEGFSGLNGEIAIREGVQRVRDALSIVSHFEKLIPVEDVEAFVRYGREVLILACLVGEVDHIQPALGDSLRRDRRLQQDVKRVMMHTERLEEIIWDWRKVRGKRHLKEREEAIWIHIAEVVRDAGHDLWIPVVTMCALRTGGSEIVEDLVISGISSEICGLPYAVDGDRLQTELGIRKGPEVGEALKDLMRVQLCYFRRASCFDKNGKAKNAIPTAEDCVARLKARRALAEELVKT